MRIINWFGVAGGAAAILLIVASIYTPWWELKVGEEILEVNFSPLNTNFSFLGNNFIIPLILAFNISSILLLLLGGITMLIYALNPSKPYSKRLLSFAYKKPIYAVVFFLIGVIAIILILKLIFGMDIPLYGSTRTRLSFNVMQGVTLDILMSTTLQWPFWFALIATGLCIAARLYHGKIAAI